VAQIIANQGESTTHHTSIVAEQKTSNCGLSFSPECASQDPDMETYGKNQEEQISRGFVFVFGSNQILILTSSARIHVYKIGHVRRCSYCRAKELAQHVGARPSQAEDETAFFDNSRCLRYRWLNLRPVRQFLPLIHHGLEATPLAKLSGGRRRRPDDVRGVPSFTWVSSYADLTDSEVCWPSAKNRKSARKIDSTSLKDSGSSAMSYASRGGSAICP
jgi:hypothetical protein